MNWRSLWQPRHPAFWMLVVLNAVGGVLSVLSQTLPLTTAARLVLLVFGIGNLWFSWRFAKVLMNTHPAGQPSTNK